MLHADGGQVTLPVPVVDEAAALRWTGEEVVLLAVKSQDTEAACGQLARTAPATTPVVCAQNGVENERRVLRRFPSTYGMCVMCPASHLAAGVVVAHSSPISGLLDVGRYPSGTDATAGAVAAALRASTFDSRTLPDVMRWKYTKLLKNLANAVEALCGPGARDSDLDRAARREGEAVLRAAGIEFASWEEDAARRDHLMTLDHESRDLRVGGSSWQSLARRTGSIEADFLNGEVALLGRLHGVPTPVNDVLQRRANDAARRGAPPGEVSPASLMAEVRSGTTPPPPLVR